MSRSRTKALRRERRASTYDVLEAVIRNPVTHAQVRAIPTKVTGRPRSYPVFMWIVYEMAVSLYGSARKVEQEFGDPRLWRFLRHKVKEQFPTDQSKWLPDEPMRRTHYMYARNYLADPEILVRRREIFRRSAIEQCVAMGLLDPAGAGSPTHPELARMIYGDGKVIEPLFAATPDVTRVDRRTGEIVAARHDPDAAVQIEGGGNEVYGIKFVVVSARSDAGRVILEIRHVPHAKGEGGEAAVALRVFDEVAPLAPGIIGVIWDMALRGVHINTLMRKLGWLTVARVAAKERRHRRGQRGGFRVPKSAFVEAQDLKLRDGTIRKVPLYAVDGALGIGELNDRGERIFRPLRRVRTQRYPGGRGWRWYNQYALPDEFAKREINVRLHGDDSDAKRRFNRAENLRAIAPSDPDFDRLYALRPDAESLNRSIEDSLYLKKAHSVGRHRQEADFLGFALMTNSLTLARHRARERIAAA